MLSRKTENQESGDMSPNIRNSDGDITISYGPSSEELKLQVLGILWESFPRIRDEAIRESRSYVEKFVSDFFSDLSDGNAKLIEKSLKNPDKITAITETLYSVAKKTKTSNSEVLRKLLVNKISMPDEKEEESLMLDQALQTTSKISKTHVAFLSFVYFIKNLSLKFGGVAINNIKKEEYAENGFFIKGPLKIEAKSVHQSYKFFYENNLNLLFKNTIENGLVRPVHRSYLEYSGSIKQIYNGDNYKRLMSMNIGQDITSIESKGSFHTLYYLRDNFGFSDIDDIESVVLTPIGERIGQAFYESNS